MPEVDDIINETAQEIDDYVSYTSALEMIAKEFNLPFNASPLYNFRDALNHYKSLYENSDNIDKVKIEENSIYEHLFRGLKDIIIYITISLKFKLQFYSNDVITFDSFSKKNEYRKLIHKLKNIELDIRANSESMCLRTLAPFIDRLNETIEDIKATLQSDNAIYILNKRI
ncbi:MAG: hypothetical protein GY754_38055 [bacterium]|nr:hypothetical protein [bacterium]